jgi:hypothetical protein
MSNQVNLTDMSDVTFSQASEAGLTHSDSLDGRMIGPSGRDPALTRRRGNTPTREGAGLVLHAPVLQPNSLKKADTDSRSSARPACGIINNGG